MEVLLQLLVFSPADWASRLSSLDRGWQGHLTDANDILLTSVELGQIETPNLAVPPHVSRSIYQVRFFIKHSCHFSF